MKNFLFGLLFFIPLLTSPAATGDDLWLVASPDDLSRISSAIAHGDRTVLHAYDDLKRDARKAIEMKRFSVTDKTMSAASGDKHDYFSLASYWWPDPSKPDGLPYVRKDGKPNPTSKDPEKTDAERLRLFADAVESLALTWRFQRDAVYAEKGAELLRSWFLEDATRMNPNLEYAQAVPGINSGQEEGIIEGRHFIRLMQSALWLRESDAWTTQDHEALQGWFREYLKWLSSSEKGLDERNADSNHGSWYDTQSAAVALFVGEFETARTTLNHLRSRWKTQFDSDGMQPEEIKHSNSLHYSVFNLLAHLTAVQLGKHTGLDLWNDPASPMEESVETLLPYLMDRGTWPHQQSKALDGDYVLHLLRLAEGFEGRSLPEDDIPSLGLDGNTRDSRWRVLLPGR